MQGSLVNILIKHKEFFKLENQAKKIEKNLANSVKKQIKEIEHQRKKSVFFEANPQESPILIKIPTNSIRKKEENPKKSKEMCWFLTEKTNNMVKTEVLKDLKGNEGDIMKMIESQMPKKKEKKLEIALRKRMGFWGMIGKFQDLSQTTSNLSKNV